MNKLIELAGGKSSDVIKAMCDGLEAVKDDEDFLVNMLWYGRVGTVGQGKNKRQVCFGCAATCAVMQVTGRRYTPDSIVDGFSRCRFQAVEFDELEEFESAVDAFRNGWPCDLMQLCKTPHVVWSPLFIDDATRYLPLTTSHWREDLPAVRRFAGHLELAGY